MCITLATRQKRLDININIVFCIKQLKVFTEFKTRPHEPRTYIEIKRVDRLMRKCGGEVKLMSS